MPYDSTWVNVFHFSKYPNVFNGDRFPALFIKNDGNFHFCFAYNREYNQCNALPFDFGIWYKIIIKQYKSCGKYWYEIIIDDAVKLRIENKFPEYFIDVKLFASDPWLAPMTSDIGQICDETIGGMGAAI